MDDLKISHKNMAVVENIAEALNNNYGKESTGHASWADPRISWDDY